MNDSAYREKTVFVLLMLASAVCAVLSGGIMWQSCIIPAFILLLVCAVLLKEINIYCVILSAILFLICGFSVALTYGNVQNGIYEAEKLMLFVLALMAGSSGRLERIIPKIIYTVALITAMAGLVVYIGIADITDFTVNDNGILRLQSFLKYANTAACLFGAGYFACLETYRERTNSIHLSASALILAGLYLTLSKAALPLFILTGVLYVYKRRETVQIFAGQNFYALLFMPAVIYTVRIHIYFVSFLLVVLYVFVAQKPFFIKKEKLLLRILLLLLLSGMLCAAALVLVKPELFATLSQRLVYMRDAAGQVLKNPLTGCGAGSWRVLQFSCQTAPYSTPYVHNGFLQYLTECGFLFTGLFVAVLAGAVIKAIKEGKYYAVCILLLICAHSLVDFDLSFGIILVITGLLAGDCAFKKNTGSLERLRILPAVVCVIMLALTGYMTAEYFVRGSFEKYSVREKYDKALERLDILEWFCRYDSTIQQNRAAILEKSTGDTEKIKSCIDNAMRLSPYDPDIYEAYIRYNMTADNIEAMLIKYVGMKERHEETYVTVKELVNYAYNKKIIDENDKNRLDSEFADIRFKNKVYDRDELLDRIMKKRKQQTVQK